MQWSSLCSSERDYARLLLVDALALSLAGPRAPELGRVLAGAEALGPGEVPVPGTHLRLPAPQAAFALSALIHAWDFDDTHDEAVVHTTAVAVPAAFVAAVADPAASGTDLLDGVVTGVHVLSRLARLVGPRPGVIRTAGLGAPAAAAAAATVRGADTADVEQAMALSLAATLSPTTRQTVVDGSILKRAQPAFAVQAGVTAAFLARAGVRGPAGWLSGEFGLVPGAGLEAADVLDGSFEGAGIALKPYPACRYTHAALAAAEELHSRFPDVSALQEVRVAVPAGPAYGLVSRPYEDRGEPIIDAQFSIPWQIAALWATGRYDLRTLAGEGIGRRDIAELAARVRVTQSLPVSAAMSGASVEILVGDGETHRANAPMPGSPQSPLDAEQVLRKAETCLAVRPDIQLKASDLMDLVTGLETVGPGKVVDALAPLYRSL